MKSKFTVAFSAMMFGLLIMSATPAKADFLGLAPGDYTVTLQGSIQPICGGSNCVGSVHIGSPGATGFDWLFEFFVPSSLVFDFSHITNTGILSATSDCAIESLTSLTMNGCDATNAVPYFTLFRQSTGTLFWELGAVAFFERGLWTAVPLAIPEPLSSSLLLFGLGALGLWRRLREKQD